MRPSFSFQDSGRVFACEVGQAHARDSVMWWWFTVSSDAHRYAPFPADASDTEDSVRSRVVTYYDALITRRTAPRQPWVRPGPRPVAPQVAPGAPDPVPAAEEERKAADS